jgi:hypothetical protein
MDSFGHFQNGAEDKQKEAHVYASVLATRVWTKMPDYPASDPEALTEAEIGL